MHFQIMLSQCDQFKDQPKNKKHEHYGVMENTFLQHNCNPRYNLKRSLIPTPSLPEKGRQNPDPKPS